MVCRYIENIVHHYRSKLNKFRKSWDDNLKSLSKSQDMTDPQELLDSALDEKMIRINRAIEQSEKYSQYVIDLHLKRKKLFESILRRDLRKEVLKKNKEEQRSKSIHEKIEDYEAKRERAREVEKQLSKKLKEDEKALDGKFKRIEQRLHEIEEDRVKQLELKEKLSKQRFEHIKMNKEKEYEVIIHLVSNILKEYLSFHRKSHKKFKRIIKGLWSGRLKELRISKTRCLSELE